MLLVSFNQNNMNKTAFCGIKPKKEVMTKAVRQGQSKLDYSKFDPYFIRILIDEGCSISEIAHDIGQNEHRVRRILEHFGLKTQIAMLLDAIKPEELKKMLDAKKSQKEIADHFMIDDVAALTPLIKKVGGNTATQDKVNSIRKEDLQNLADEGFSVNKIAEKYQVAERYIRQRMKDLGIKTKWEEIQEKIITVEEIKRFLFDLGLNVSEISKKRGVPESRIYKIMRDNNIKTATQQMSERFPSKEEYAEARKVCKSMKEYTEKLGIGIHKAKKYMHEYNIKPFKVKITDPSVILELLKKNPNMSVEEIARELDLPARSVDSAVSKFKIPIMHTSVFYDRITSADTAKRFNKNIAMGDTPTQLGEQYGLSSERIVEIADSLNDYRIRNLRYSPYYENYLVKNCDLSTCKPSPDKETVDNCIKKICGSWENFQELYSGYRSYKSYTNKLQKILKELQVSEDTLNYLVKKYNIA